jgi:hypothetical protein
MFLVVMVHVHGTAADVWTHVWAKACKPRQHASSFLCYGLRIVFVCKKMTLRKCERLPVVGLVTTGVREWLTL